jgi:pyrimidine operon attenuation protein/uracil phosphoribosyltransferase
MTQAAPPRRQSPEGESLVTSGDDMRRAIKRMAHEIVERNGEGCDVVLAGIPTRGVPLAARLAAIINDWGRARAEVLPLDVADHRDDREVATGENGVAPRGAERPADGVAAPAVTGRVVVLVDDVIFHGRTARAALDALTELGRPSAVQLAALVDRGHRELPIRADYVGKNIPTHLTDRVRVLLKEVDGVDAVFLVRECD